MPGTIAVLERLADVLELVDEAGALVVPVLAPVDLLHPGLRRDNDRQSAVSTGIAANARARTLSLSDSPERSGIAAK